MMRSIALVCLRCKDTFPITAEEGYQGAVIICPWCGCASELEWFHGQDGLDCRLVAPNIAHILPPTGTVEAVTASIAFLQNQMCSQMGIPAHLMNGPLPTAVDLRARGGWGPPDSPATGKRPYEYIEEFGLLDDKWECGGKRPTIIEQAQFMGMRVFNNRKRMRKRVRQRRRHFDPYEDHWTNDPNGDW